MFCTGGVRCEKASAYLIQHCGFAPQDVLQLRGGIQSWLTHHAGLPGQEQANTAGRWNGLCYVFDERTALDGRGTSIGAADASAIAATVGLGDQAPAAAGEESGQAGVVDGEEQGEAEQRPEQKARKSLRRRVEQTEALLRSAGGAAG